MSGLRERSPSLMSATCHPGVRTAGRSGDRPSATMWPGRGACWTASGSVGKRGTLVTWEGPAVDLGSGGRGPGTSALKVLQALARPFLAAGSWRG